jgi:hypothetical protein
MNKTPQEGDSVLFWHRPMGVEPSPVSVALVTRAWDDGGFIDLVVHDRTGRPNLWKRVPRQSRQNVMDVWSPMSEHEADHHTAAIEQLRDHVAALRRAGD